MSNEEENVGIKRAKPEGEEQMDPKTVKYIQELLTEKNALDPSSHSSRLIQQEIDKTLEIGKMPFDTRFLDVYHERTTRVMAKVMVPVKQHPHFNFVGKLLGPKGNTLKSLQEETQCKMAVLGRGSMKDREKEESLRQGLDPRFAHLSDILHVEVSALASPAEAYARMAYALAELRKYLIPDTNDEIAQQQQRELGFLQDDNYMEEEVEGDDYEGYVNAAPSRPSNGPPFGARGRGAVRGTPRGAPRGAVPTRGLPRGRGTSLPYSRGGVVGRGTPRGSPRGAPRGRGAGGSSAAYVENTYSSQETSGYTARNSFSGTGQNNFGADQSYNSGNSDFQRRPVAPSFSNDGHYQGENTGTGAWKRGGFSRYTERAAPYSRR